MIYCDIFERNFKNFYFSYLSHSDLYIYISFQKFQITVTLSVTSYSCVFLRFDILLIFIWQRVRSRRRYLYYCYHSIFIVH